MIPDPIEKIVADALGEAGLTSDRDCDASRNLDFYVREPAVYVEVKQFHSPRISEQMARAENVIAIQGEAAARWFSELIRAANRSKHLHEATK